MTVKHDDQKSMGYNKISSKMKFIAIKSYLKKQEPSQINNLTLHLKQLEKEEQQQQQQQKNQR